MNCIIVDDEYPARMELKYFISQYPQLSIVKEFETSNSVLNFLEDNSIDVIFLDINMPGLSGIELGGMISKLKKKPLIVFITAYSKFAVDAFTLHAFDYLLKPYSSERIHEALENIISFSKEKKDPQSSQIPLYFREKVYLIPIEDIDFLEVCNRETKVYAKGKIYFSKDKLSKLEETLPKNFFRTHRSFIVNLNSIFEISSTGNATYSLSIKSYNEQIPVSRSYIKEFKNVVHV